MAENWREKFKEQIISSPDYVGNKTVSDPDWREKMKAAVIDGSAAKAYNAESKRMATEAAYNKKVSQGKSAYEKYLSGTKSDGKKKKSFLDYFANVGYAGDTSLPNGGMSSAVMQIERDHDKPQPINISALSDDQLKDFYYLYSESPEKAKEYVEETNNKNAAIKADERAKWAGKNTGTRILSAVAQAPVSAISMADYLNQLAWYNATGEVYTERNADSPTMLSRSLIGGAAQGLTEKGLFNTGLLKGEIDESIPIVGGMSLGSAYQLGTSMINSAVSAATQGSIGAVFMGGSAASNAFYDALDKGASADQAIYNGLAQGTAEALFEYVSLDNLIKMDVSAPLIKNVLKQGGIEASEEAMTSISNYVTDAIIMKGRSEYAELLEKYNGNKSKAYMAMVNQVAQDAIGGFISGGGLTLINYGTNGVFNSRQTKKAYSPVVQDLVAESLELNPDNKLAKKIQDKINSGKSISGRNITKLINQNEADMQANDRATIQAAAAEQLTKYGESGDVEALASAITKLTAGENLSRSERALIDNSEYGQRVANELAPENIDSGEYNTEWAETLGTDRINAEAYSRLLQDAQVETEQQPVDTAPVVENIQQSPTVRETAEVTSSETPTSQTVKSSLPASDTQADTKSSVKDLSTKYGKQAGAFIHTYQQGQDIKKYDEAYSNAYDYGRSGVPFSTVKGLEGVAYLTEKQQELAYDAGTAAANDEAVAKAKDRTSRANGKIGRRIGAVKLEGAPASSLNEQQKRATRVLRTVAEATGVDIVLYKSDVNEAGAYEGANGRFDPKSPDKIYIDLNSGLLEDKDANDIGKYAMLRTFSHEFVHFVEFWNSVRYNELRKLVFEEITAHGENVNDLIDTKIEETGLSYERASREVVAEAMTDILPDSKFVQNMAESHKSLFNKLLEKLKEFAADIRAYFKTIGSNRDAGAKALKEQVGETVKYLDSIIDMFDTAATEAVETFQKAYAVDETEHVADKLENAEASTVSEETETAEPEAEQVKSEPKTTTSEHGYTVTDNNEYGRVEVKFDDKPAEAVRDVLKANKFRWNKAKKVWYGKTSHDAIVDALNKAYEAESSPEAKSDFMKSWERATQAEKDEVVDAINQNTKLSHIAPTEIREEIPAQAENITEVNDNGAENEINEGTVHSSKPDGDGAARLLDELQAGDVQRAGGQREAVASAEDRGRQAERDGDRADSSDRSGGSEGDGQSRDLQRGRGDDGQRRVRGDRAGQAEQRALGELLRTEESAERSDERGRVTQEEQKAKSEKLREAVSEQIEQQSTESPKGSNFVIGESLNLPTGEKSRFRANIDAIKLIKQLEDEGRNATAAEQEVLSKYVGWGGLSNAFGELRYNSETHRSEMMAKTGWEKEFEEFRQLVTDGVITEKEYQGMSASTKNAHYTSVEVIKAMYDGLDQLGFKGGRMLEPSSGVGNFVGGMPVGMSSKVTSWTMVELDRITGLIAKYLYPQANVRIQGFEAANIPDNYMDVAIGNVPFGNYGVVDRNYPKRITKAIHNYFFAKTLDKVRPGGIVMFITSSFTMNGQDTAIRQYIMDRADLLGAIRLPNTAFAGNAGTEVVTDILVLKKRAPGTEYAGEAFLEAPSRSVGESWQRANVNEYFDNHPEMVLGNAELARGMYGANTLTYTPFTNKGSLGEQIREAFKNITGKMDYTAQVTPEKANFAVERANKKTKQHGLEVKEDGVYRNVDGHLEKVSSDKATTERVSALLGVRDAYRTLVNYLQQGQDAKFVKQARKSLNKAYDDFVKKYGPINSAKNKSALAEDPDQYSLLSLENYDAKKKTATKADIFTKDTITANKTVTHVDDVATGVIVSINRTGGIDTALIAKITDSTEEAVTRQLIDSRLAFKTKNGELEAPETYLSGNVRAKLREAEALVPYDSDYKHNVEELKKVIPQDIPFNDIYVTVGSPWIPNNLYADFIAEMLGGRNMETAYSGPDVSVGRTSTGEFKIVLNNKRLKSRYQNTQKWGTSRKSFLDIMDCLMSSTGIKVNDYVEDDEGRRKPVLNKVETAAAQEKAEAITKEFQEWLWRDENRRNELSSLYNETFNALVTPKYNGANLTVNGLNAEFTLREHQANAVQRIISSGGNTLLAHRVGAGKTLEMAAAAMKLRELGIVKKPVFVVPKSLVAQWGVEFKSYFPAARLLVSDEKSFTTANRKVYSNRIANGDYDAVILSYEQFEKIPMSTAYLQDFYQQQIDEIIDAIAEEKAESRDGKGLTVKEMEKKKAQLEKKIAELTSKPKDEDNIDFEQLGIDSLFVDEAHNFKNLQYTTRMNNVSGLSNSNGSQRAFDLYAKVRYLQSLNGGRGIVFATATPVMNSMAEMYIMQKYLQSDMLEQLGLKTFDAWAKQFGEVVNSVEIKPSGQGFRVKQTFSNFRNLSELQLLFRSFSDVLTQVPGLKIPKMKGGKVKTIVCEPGEFQRNYMKLLEERADNVKNVDPSEDNMLKITSDGRKVSYTQRMIDPSLPYEPGCKLYRCCDNVLEEYKASNEIKGTQIIFCDMATPKGKSKTSKTVSEEVDDDVFDTESAQLYDDMRAYLVKRGIPKKEIAFIHEADTDAKKKQLFADVNDGKVRVLIGSTGKMGVGMNAQKRIVAIHHLDAPWRPGDVEQRDGRAFRQKNMNDEVSKYTYVTEGSFDARLWDILDRKQHFIDQIMNGEDVGRSAEDTGEVTLSAAEVKALASGNPMIMEQVQLSTDLAKLQDLKRAYNSSITAAKAKLLEDEQRIATLKDSIAKGKQDIKATVDTYSDGKFSMTVGKRKFTEKKDAGKALASEIVSKAKEGEFTTVGKFAGFELRIIKQKAEYIGTVVGAQNYRFNVYPENSTYMVNHIIGVIQGIEHKIGVWSDRLTETETDLAAQEAIIAAPFAKQAELDAKTSRFNEVMSILNPKDEQVIGDEGDVQYQARKYWRPSLTQAEWDRLNTLKAKEVETNLNFIDSETKWLYNVSSGNAIFAVYSTADTENPTVLYASTGEQAKAEANTLISVLEEYRNADIGTETFGSWVETHGLQRSPDGIYSYQSVHSGNANSDDGLDVRKSGRKPSAAFTSCLKNIGIQFQHDTISDASSIRRRDARAIMSESRIDDLIADSSAGKRADYAQAWITSINPTDFLNMTLGEKNQNREKFDMMPGDYGSTIKDYDFIEGGLKKEKRQTPYLAIDVDTGEVVGHEGRHRMRALEKEGVTYAEIKVEFRDSDGRLIKEKQGYGIPLKPIDRLEIFNQRGTGQSAILRNIIPLNKANRDHILQSYGKADEGDIRFQQRTSPLTDREVLSIAASEVNVEGLTDGERDALNIFKRRLDNLNELEQKRAEEGRKYKEQQFGANVDRAEAKKTLNRMKILDDQIKRASSEVLDVEKKEVLKRVLQRSRKVVEKAEREHGQELLRRYRDRRNNAAAIKKYRDRITVTSMQLSDWLLKNSDKEHVPEVLKKPVLELLTSIDFSSKRLLSGGQETKADKKFGANLAALNKLLEGQQGAIDGVDNAVDNIGAYLDISAENRQFLNDLVSTVASASSDGTTFTINRMTSEELKNFSHFLKNLSTAIRKANATLANARYENIPSMAQDSMAHMEAMGEARALDGTKLVKLIGWKNATPYFAFKRFGEAGKSLFEGLYKGWGKMAFHQQEILNFTKELYKAKEVRKWRSDIHDITLEDGSKIQMSTAQIMELSMLMKREQALKHINGVGIRIGNIKTKSGIKQDTNYYKLTVGDMDNIKKLLTQRQLKVAQDMQKYMAKRGAEWGNEISMARFGYEFYTEGENYYPIKTDDNSRPMRDTDIQGNSMFRLLNLSASKSLNQYANNALVVGDIFDTFTEHMTDMAKLNALGLPILDAIKWFNYRERTNNPDGTINEQSLTKSMEKAFGKAAGNYFRTLMKDINGVKESGDRSGDIFNKMLTRYKIAAVAANIRVALLQPTSYVRAQYIIKKRHLLNAFVFKKNGYNEAMKYSGTAVWKSLGYYDTDIARSMRTQIENGDAVLDKVRDWSMGLAELGDKRTWGRLWVACKLQTKSENPRLTGDALCKATAELFDEMIYATQVMDSTLTRSEIMRGTTRADKLVSAFGAEPTLSANIVMDAASEYMIDMRKTDARTAWRKNKDKIALAFTTYVSSAAFAAFVESLWDAVRDDDDYETFLEKFMQAFLGEDGLLSGNLVQDLTIIGKIPELKAIIEVLTGDKSSDMSIASLESISSTYSIWKETIQLTTGELQDPTKVTYYGKMTPWGKIYKTLQALSQISGVAVSNGARDVIAVWNTIVGSFAPSRKLKTYDPGTAGSIKHAYLGGALTETEAIDELIKAGEAEDNDEAYWLVKQWETGSGKYEALKGAIMANDAAAFNSAMSELTANGVEEKTARSEAASIIGDMFSGTDDEPASINAAQAISMLQRYGGKDSDEANDTVNLWKFKAGDEKYKDISMPAVRKYNEYCASVGISKDVYFDAWSTINDIHGEDYDGDGKNDAYSAMDKKLSYIDSLSISSSQKTALALANGISEKQINNRAPW